MKALILAAGRGSRLAPLTDHVPKCLVQYQGEPILKYELDSLLQCGIDEIGIVGGYRFEVLKHYIEKNYSKKANFSFFFNELHSSTNMVHTFFCARDFLDEELILSYSDILYSPPIVRALQKSEGEVNVVIDKAWQKLWEQRFENPLEDAETLKIREGRIKEIGKKPQTLEEIEGQYMGLLKFSKEFLPRLICYYEGLDRERLYDGKDYSNMYMTSLLQGLIETFDNVLPVLIEGGWGEIDAPSDLEIDLRLAK
ncbi:phosphocholine cytidylyltransferase family protein [Wolinella succinogenes]|uniref:phosphocholine cytidylyltransferase family protein n=1 Tax=Wolinella succinogenes TaxID=844 RepID=UPI002FC6E4D1